MNCKIYDSDTVSNSRISIASVFYLFHFFVNREDVLLEVAGKVKIKKFLLGLIV